MAKVEAARVFRGRLSRTIVGSRVPDARLAGPWPDPNVELWVSPSRGSFIVRLDSEPGGDRATVVIVDDPTEIALAALTNAVLGAQRVVEHGPGQLVDLVSESLTTAAVCLGGSSSLVGARLGQWQATHVEALTRGAGQLLDQQTPTADQIRRIIADLSTCYPRLYDDLLQSPEIDRSEWEAEELAWDSHDNALAYLGELVTPAVIGRHTGVDPTPTHQPGGFDFWWGIGRGHISIETLDLTPGTNPIITGSPS